MSQKTDPELIGNHLIEEAIHAFKEQTTDETLAHVLTVIRNRVQEQGHLIIAVDMVVQGAPLSIRPVTTSDGSKWWAVFTSYEEEMKGKGKAQPVSLFTASMEQIFNQVKVVPEISGVIVNPWSESLPLNKKLIDLVMQYRTSN